MKKNNKTLFKAILPWIVVLLLLSSLFPFLMKNGGSKELTYSQFMTVVKDKKITNVTITPNSFVTKVEGSYKKNSKGDKVNFTTIVPKTDKELDSLTQILEDKNVKIKVTDSESDNMIWNILGSILPYVILFGGMFWVFKNVNGAAGGNNKAFEFGNSRAKLERNSKTRFTDVAGEANVPFYSISGSEFVEMFVGVGAGRVRDMFKKAKENAPCIIFIDEIDAVGRQRGTGVGGGHDEREQTLNQLLVEMDGFEGNEGVIILAATNRADVLDPALLRPGRFDRQIRVSNPDKRARSQILKVHARNKHFAPDVDFDNIAQRTPGFSGAELANVLNEAALLAVRSGHQMITLSDVDEAIDRVIGGPAKKSRKYTEHERKLVAYHETGHAIIGLTLEDANQVQKVTIVPRGDAGGYNLMTPREETYFSTKKQLLATITGYMGGRTAEEIFFGDVSSGAHNDIEQATRIARMMVTELGMSELGPIKYDSGDNAVFLGRDYSQLSNTHSGQIAFEIDQQVRKIIETAHSQATEIINNNKDKMDIIANALLEHETLNHEQIQSLYNTGKMPETYDGTEEHVESNDDNNNTPEPPKADPEDDLLDEMK